MILVNVNCYITMIQKGKLKKKVGIIGTVGVPACYGGYETLVENLLDYKQNPELEYQVYCSSKSYKEKKSEYKGAKLRYIPFNANGTQAPIYDTLSLLHAYFSCDIILSLGTVGSFILPFMKLFSKKKVIFNLDGLDNERAKFSSFSQKVIGKARKIAAKYGDVCISDNQGIKDYAQRVYKRDSVLIEYGGDQAKPIKNIQKLCEKYGLRPFEYSFKVARIEPENNIETILEAYSELPDEYLVVVGNWNRSEFGRTMKGKFSEYRNIRMMDPIYEPSEINLLRSNCKLYIHGHSAGGTNPSLVEAMNLGLPIIANGVVYNRETTENKAKYFSDHDKDSLKKQVVSLSKDDKARNEIAIDMAEIAKRRYTWKRIANLYEKLFD